MTARKIWMPNPQEACDGTFSHSKEITYKVKSGEERTRSYKDKYAWARHCKTKDHVLYLIRHRLPYVMAKIGGLPQIIKRAEQLSIKGLMLCDDRWPTWFMEFKKDALSGKYPETDLEVLEPGITEALANA